MSRLRVLLAAGALLALAGCVTDDYDGSGYYGGYDGYGYGYPAYGYSYPRPRYDYPRYDYRDYADERPGIVTCEYGGRKIRTTAEDCWRRRRAYEAAQDRREERWERRQWEERRREEARDEWRDRRRDWERERARDEVRDAVRRRAGEAGRSPTTGYCPPGMHRKQAYGGCVQSGE